MCFKKLRRLKNLDNYEPEDFSYDIQLEIISLCKFCKKKHKSEFPVEYNEETKMYDYYCKKCKKVQYSNTTKCSWSLELL